MYRRLIGKLVLIVPVSLLAICGSLGQTSQIKESYLPLAKGNQWCYRDSQSVWPDGHVEIDATIVNADSNEIIDGSEYYFFRSGFPMYVDSPTNDTIERM